MYCCFACKQDHIWLARKVILRLQRKRPPSPNNPILNINTVGRSGTGPTGPPNPYSSAPMSVVAVPLLLY